MRKTTIGKKDQSNSRESRCQFRKLQLAVLFMMICVACVVSRAGTSRLYPPAKDETGALRLVQVVQFITREYILAPPEQLTHLLASGLKDSDIKDGSVAVGRIYCCHEWTERGTNIWFYVPPDVPVNEEDLVIVRMGRGATKKDPGTVNVVIEVRQKKDAPDSRCSWVPPDDRMWTRVLYCDWMPAEGWTHKGGLHNTWLKRASDAKAQ